MKKNIFFVIIFLTFFHYVLSQSANENYPKPEVEFDKDVIDYWKEAYPDTWKNELRDIETEITNRYYESWQEFDQNKGNLLDCIRCAFEKLKKWKTFKIKWNYHLFHRFKNGKYEICDIAQSVLPKPMPRFMGP